MNRTALACTAMICTTIACVTILNAGPTDPPAGPIAGTYKTLAEIEPRTPINSTTCPGDADSLYRITRAGSYYFTGNLTGVSGKSGIEIAVSHVTVDLMGHVLTGVAGSIDGVRVTATTTGVVVRNGSVTQWGQDGIDLQDSNLSSGGTVESINASSNGNNGIHAGRGAVVRACTAEYNGLYGISGNTGSTIEACTARNCDYGGFGGSATTFSRCSSFDNDDDGFKLYSGSTATDCVSTNNAGSGYYSSTRGNSFTRCSAYYNSENGITLYEGNTAADCTVVGSGTHGIVAYGWCLVRNNLSMNNGFGAGVTDGSGIYVAAYGNTVEANTCANNDVGILLGDFSGSNRIDANSARSNGVSFEINGHDNLVTRNTATGGSPNYSVTAGNSVAPRVSVADSDGWAGITNANHPFANFGY